MLISVDESAFPFCFCLFLVVYPKSVIMISLCRTAKRNPLTRVRDKDCVKSKKLLAENESIIKEISEELGFADAPHFVKFFKKGTGMTPGQFKETL